MQYTTGLSLLRDPQPWGGGAVGNELRGDGRRGRRSTQSRNVGEPGCRQPRLSSADQHQVCQRGWAGFCLLAEWLKCRVANIHGVRCEGKGWKDSKKDNIWSLGFCILEFAWGEGGAGLETSWAGEQGVTGWLGLSQLWVSVG